MAVENLTATALGPISLASTTKAAPRPSTGAMVYESTVEVTAAASATSTYLLARLPSGARIHGISQLAFDDLASTGAPTLDIGTFGVDGNVTTDDADSINDGIDVATAAAAVALVKDIANYGKPLWEVAGESSDPGGLIDVKATLADAATNTGGTVTATIVYTVD